MFIFLTFVVSLALVAGVTFPTAIHSSSGWKLDETRSFSSDSSLTMRLALHPNNAAFLAEKVSSIADPKSPDFRNYLTSEQLSELVGVSQSDLDRVLNWVKESGFELVEVPQNRDWITVRASVGAIEKGLQTKLASWSTDTNGESKVGALASYTIPDDLADVIHFVPGLATLSSASWHPVGFERGTPSVESEGEARLPSVDVTSAEETRGQTGVEAPFTASSPELGSAPLSASVSSHLVSAVNAVITDPLLDYAYLMSNQPDPAFVHFILPDPRTDTIDAASIQRFDYELQKMAARGISVLTVSAVSCGTQNRTHHSYLFSQYLTIVGSANGDFVADQSGARSADAGGFCSDTPRPFWQDAAVRSYMASAQYETVHSNARAFPDVVTSGDPPEDVNRLVPPVHVLARMIANLNHALLSQGLPPVGWMNPWLYANPQIFAESADSAVLNDRAIASTSWNPVTGLGTPIYHKMLDLSMEHSKKRQLRSRERHAPTNNTSHSSYVSGLSTTYTNMDGGNMPTGSATILGSGAGHFCGRQVANIGDFNKDGFPDFAFGCHGASVVYVIFGKGTGFDTAMDLAAFQTGPSGMRIIAYQTTYRLGGPSQIVGVGDTNGDGIDDFVIGMGYINGAFIIFGRTTVPADITVQFAGGGAGATLSKASGYRVILTNGGGGPYSIAAAGDVNKDGCADFFVGIPNVASIGTSTSKSTAGRIVLLYGERTFSDSYLPLAHSTNVGIWVGGGYAVEYLGGVFESTFAAGGPTTTQKTIATADINKDGNLDLIIGSPTRRVVTTSSNVGAVTVIYGKSGGGWGTADIDLGVALALGVGFVISGPHAQAFFGAAVANAGDVNGDGIDDILIGCYGLRAPSTTTSWGGAYVIFGKLASFASFDVTNFVSSSAGFVMYGATSASLFGVAVGNAGDINGDGIQDMYIGAPMDASDGGTYATGAVYFKFGQSYLTTTYTDIMMASFVSGVGGFVFRGVTGTAVASPLVGLSVALLGDVTGDGFKDFLIGSSRSNTNGLSGTGLVYVFTPGGAASGGSTPAGPSVEPTSRPSVQPTSQPSSQPSRAPSSQPTHQPTALPTSQPSRQPTSQPVVDPTSQPSAQPSRQPASRPSAQPSRQPSSAPTTRPSAHPISSRTAAPSSQPSSSPTAQPIANPSARPSAQPLSDPSAQPSSQPTGIPSLKPRSLPTSSPSGQPSSQPSSKPTTAPSGPTSRPSAQPSGSPSSQPTGQPSTAPLATPSARPTDVPSSRPTGEPSVQPLAIPTSQPSGVPSAQPVQKPSAFPTGVPSSQPSGAPTTKPSRAPSALPSSQPTSVPSGLPTTVPSSQPVVRPTSVPTSQPSAIPSQQPVLRPTAFPSSAPSAQPSGSPSTQPSGMPTRQPVGEPSALPTTQPSEQPTSQPSGQPSSAPSAEPNARPSAQPSSNPSALPSAQPSAVPSGQPISRPSAQPSAQPSVQPVGAPSTQPTSRPSGQPSSQPSQQPNARPSSVPSGSPSCRPSSQPSHQPTGQPSGAPSTQPSGQPTVPPSAPPSSQPTIQPSAAPSQQPVLHPTAFPSSAPSAQPSGSPSCRPSSKPSHQPTGQPSGAPSTQPSGQPTVQPSAQPSSQPTIQPSAAPSGQPTTHPSAQPFGRPTAQPTVVPSSQPSHQPTGQPSAVPTSQPSAQPSVAPSRPTIAPTPTLPTVKPSVAPSARPSTAPTYVPGVPTASPVPTGGPTFAPTLHPSATMTVAPSLDPSPPVLTVTTGAITRRTVTLTVAMDAAVHSGVVLCSATPKGANLTSVDTVLTAGHATSYLVGATTTTVTLTGLQSVTDYDVYCAASASSGVTSSLSAVTATMRSVRTACCNDLTFTAAPAHVYGELSKYTAATLPLFKYALSSAPSKWLTVTPTVHNAAGAVVPSSVVSVQPASANFTRGSGPSGSFLLSASPLLNGTYTVSLELSGASSADFENNIVARTTLLATSTTAPAPVLQTAQFADNGASIIVTFDSATDHALMARQSFPCQSLFTFLGVNTTTCSWSSSSVVRIVFDAAPLGTNLVVTGGLIRLRGHRVKAACAASTAVCASIAFSPAQSIVVLDPSTPVAPTAVLRIPAVVSGCSDVIIDHTLSSGSGGRAWMSLVWAATAETATTSGPATDILTTLQGYGASTAVPISISKSLIASARYTISLTLVNFLGQTSSASATFVTDDNPNLPIVSIVGPTVVSIVPNDVLTLFAAASRSSCAIASSTVSFKWTVTQNGVTRNFVSIGSSTTKFALAPYTLSVSSVYTVTVVATATATTNPAYPAISASSSVTVQVGKGKLVAVVAGGSFRSLSSGDQALTLDASPSYDQSFLVGSQATAAIQSFSWTCTIASASNYGASCADKMPLISTASTLAIASTGLTYGELYVFSVTVSTPDGRTASYAVTVQNHAGFTITSISNVALTKVLPSKKLVLTGFVQGGYALDATWSAWIDGVSQSFTATTPLTGTFSSTLVANSFVYPLAVPANTFAAGSVVTFRISAHVAGNASLFASYSDVTITMNSPPTGGALSVDPTSGDALSQVFALSSYGWADDLADYPLTYEFAYRVTSTQSPLIVQTRTASTVTSTTLPAGLSAQGHGVTLISTVYDNFLATASATTGAVVTASADVDVGAYVAAQVESANAAGNMDMFAQIVANAGSSLSVVNCSAASDSFCAGLNRGACFATPQKCSPCLDGYTGLPGDGNTMCRNDGAALNGTGAGCATHDDCSYGMCVSGVCEVPTLECPSTTADVCSGHGVCDYFDRNGRAYGSVCLLTDVDCIARCSCEDGFGGLSCSLSTDEVELRSQTRAQLCQAVIEVGNSIDPSSFALDMLVSALNSAYDPHEVIAAADGATCYDALALLTDLSAAGYLSEESSAQMVNVAAKFVLNAGTAASSTTRRALNENVAAANRSARVDSAVSNIVTGILGNMAYGETPVSYSNSEIDLTVYKSRATGLSVLSAPQTSAINTYMEITNTTAEVLQTESGYIEASALLWLTNPFPHSDVLQSSLFRVEVFNAATSEEETRRRAQESIRNGTEAAFYIVSQFTATQDFNFTYTLDQAIMLGPVNYTIPQCTNYVDGVYERCGGCWVDTYTNDNVTYGCPLSALYNTTESARRLQAATDDAAGVGGSQLVQFTTLHAYVDTFAAVGGPGEFEVNWDKSKIVLAFLATLTFLIIVGFVVFLKRDHNKEESARSTRGEFARSGGAWQERSPVPASPTTDAAGAVSTSDVQYDEIYANSCAEDVESLSRGTSPAVVLPFAQELCTTSLSFWQSLCQHHKYLAVLFADSGRVSHTVKWARLTMGFLLYLFFTTVFFGVFYPDDGLCQDHLNIASCLSSDSRVTNTHLCEWSIDPSTNIGSCGLNAPPRTFVFLIVIVMVVAVVSVPFQVVYDYLLMSVCLHRPRLEEWGFSAPAAECRTATNDRVATRPYVANSVYDGSMSVHDEVLQVVEQASAHIQSVPADVPESARLKAIHDNVAVSPDGSQWNVHGAVASARAQSAHIVALTSSMKEEDMEAKSAVLLEFFLLEQFSAFKQFVLRRYLFDMSVSSQASVSPLLWVLSWAWIVISIMFFLAWAFAWACTQGGSTFAAWGIVIGTALAQDLLVIEVFRAWVIYVLSINAIRPQLLGIYGVLQRVAQSHRHSVLGDSTSDLHVCQHLSPSCRAAHTESLYSLPIAHILRGVDDADVAACHEQEEVRLPIIATVTLALPVVLSLLHDTLGVVALCILLPAFFDAVLIMSRYFYAGADLFILVLYLFPVVLFVLWVLIIRPARREVKQQIIQRKYMDDSNVGVNDSAEVQAKSKISDV